MHLYVHIVTTVARATIVTRTRVAYLGDTRGRTPNAYPWPHEAAQRVPSWPGGPGRWLRRPSQPEYLSPRSKSPRRLLPGRDARSIAAHGSTRSGGGESPTRPLLRPACRPISAITPVKRRARAGWSGRSLAAVGRVRAWRYHGRHRGQREMPRTGRCSAALSSAMPIPSAYAPS